MTGRENKTLSLGKPIIKSGTRVLRPDEYTLVRQSAEAIPGWQGSGLWGWVLLDVLLQTGMRYVEVQRFRKRPEWFDGRFVYLPTEAVEKHLRRQLERWVRLTPYGRETVKRFLECPVELPSWWAWTDAMKRWAAYGRLDPVSMSPKTTRKTWESWLMVSYPDHWMEIVLSQGHTSGTSLNHYLNMPFLPEDKVKMRPFVEGFF